MKRIKDGYGFFQKNDTEGYNFARRSCVRQWHNYLHEIIIKEKS